MTVTVTLIAPSAGSPTSALAINDAGQVVGWDGSGFVWQNGAVSTLASGGEGLAISDSGEVVGRTGAGQAAIFQNGSATVLAVSPTSGDYAAQAVNLSGEIAGSVVTDAVKDLYQAVVWQQGQMTALASLGGNSSALAINTAGEAVGFAYTTGNAEHAASWIGGGVTDLGTLAGDVSSIANSVNGQGEIAGSSSNAVGAQHAVIWIGGAISALGTLPGGSGSAAYHVNDSGVVVGTSYDSSGTGHAVAWINGGIVDLNSLIDANSGWVLTSAVSINDSDQVVGTGTYDGVTSAYLLTLPANTPPILTASAAIQGDAVLLPGTSVADHAANVAATLDALNALVTAGELTSITLTDAVPQSLPISPVQLTGDTAALGVITGDYTLTVAAGSSAVSIAGLAGHATTVQFSGDASQYAVTAANGALTVSGSGITDTLSNVAALQFADLTAIVAATPGSGGAVTTGNITELYSAVLAREPDIAGLAYYQDYLKSNPATPLLQFAEWFLASTEYTANPAHVYAESAAGDTKFIQDSYQSLLGRTPSAAELGYYQTNVLAPAVSNLTPGTQSYADAQLQAHALMLVYFSNSPEFLADVQITAQNPASAQHWLILV